jgi:glycosyltransferase involved in cell wall biosynthesis
MFGRVIPKKGYNLFLEAARRIKQESSNKAEFWILGIQDTSRRESIELFRKILAYHDQKTITYIPPTDDVIPLIQQAHVIVLPSHYNEGVPRSLLEAMACGKPLITTDWKGCREAVDNGINGYLIKKEDLSSLIQAMKFFIHAQNDILYNMGMASRRKAEKEFDETIIISKYLAEILSHSQ